MNPRESIPNVGRRAQGRKNQFMLQGSGAKRDGAMTSLLYGTEGDQGSPVRLHSNTVATGDPGSCGGGRDGSALSQPGHPYHRIIQKILERHQTKELAELTSCVCQYTAVRCQNQQAAQGHRISATRAVHPKDPDLELAAQAQSTPGTTHVHHNPPCPEFLLSSPRDAGQTLDIALASDRGRRTNRTHDVAGRAHSIDTTHRARDRASKTTDRAVSTERAPGAQNRASRTIDRALSTDRAAHGAAATHRATDRTHSVDRTNRSNDTEPRLLGSTDKNRRWSEEIERHSRKPSNPEDQPGSFHLDLARGCYTDRSHAPSDAHHRSFDVLEGRGSISTTRSETGDESSTLSRVLRKRDPQQLEDLLDYLWVYQGMSRQVLSLDSPPYAWDTNKLFKKPKKLPPIQSIFAGQKLAGMLPSVNERSSPRTENREGSDDAVPLTERLSLSEPAYALADREAPIRLAGRCELRRKQNENLADLSDGSKSRHNPDVTRSLFQKGGTNFDSEGCESGVVSSSRTRGVGGRGDTVKLVVKMPVILTQEMTCADLLEKD